MNSSPRHTPLGIKFCQPFVLDKLPPMFSKEVHCFCESCGLFIFKSTSKNKKALAVLKDINHQIFKLCHLFPPSRFGFGVAAGHYRGGEENRRVDDKKAPARAGASGRLKGLLALDLCALRSWPAFVDQFRRHRQMTMCSLENLPVRASCANRRGLILQSNQSQEVPGKLVALWWPASSCKTNSSDIRATKNPGLNLFGQNPHAKSGDFITCLVLGRPVGHDPWKFGDFGDPTAVLFLLKFDGDLHRLLSVGMAIFTMARAPLVNENKAKSQGINMLAAA